MVARPEYLIDKYQKDAIATAIYPDEIRVMLVGEARNVPASPQAEMLLRLSYVSLGLSGEAGEFANKVKKLIRDSQGFLTDELRKELGLELGGVFWYLAASAKELGYALSDIAEMNRVQLVDRRDAGTIHGTGDNR